MKFKPYSLKLALVALVIGATLLIGGSEKAYAQGRSFRQHQRMERYYGNRHGYYNRRYYGPYNRGYYNYRPFNRGYYGNRFGFGFGRGWGHYGRRGW
jgi:hypothetical protein